MESTVTSNERSRIKMLAAYQRDPEKFRERARQWRVNNPERLKVITARQTTKNVEGHLRRRYGMTLSQKQALMSDQNNQCALCFVGLEGTRKACVDHNHTTGAIRGILCINCNRSLGQLGDTYERLHHVLMYVAADECNVRFIGTPDGGYLTRRIDVQGVCRQPLPNSLAARVA